MDEWEIVEENAKAAKATLADLDSPLDSVDVDYPFLYNTEKNHPSSATHAAKGGKKRLKSTFKSI